MKSEFDTGNGTIYIGELASKISDNTQIRNAIEKLLSYKLSLRNLTISHFENGKPYLKDHPAINISISHTNATFAVYVSHKIAVGIDIEMENKVIHKVRGIFLNAAENLTFPEPTTQQLQIIWGAKEAIFKKFEGNFKQLETEVTVLEIDFERKSIEATTTHGKISCNFLVQSNYFLVWTK